MYVLMIFTYSMIIPRKVLEWFASWSAGATPLHNPQSSAHPPPQAQQTVVLLMVVLLQTIWIWEGEVAVCYKKMQESWTRGIINEMDGQV